MHLWRMPEMVAPRALVFRPLVKGNEDSGNEIALALHNLCSNGDHLRIERRQLKVLKIDIIQYNFSYQ